MSENRKTESWLRYSSLWRKVLVNVLDWPPERAEEFILNLKCELDSAPDDINGFAFFYDLPSKFLFRPILGDGLHEKLMHCKGISPAVAAQLLTRAIAGASRESRMEEPDFDWTEARQRYIHSRRRMERRLACRQKL